MQSLQHKDGVASSLWVKIETLSNTTPLAGRGGQFFQLISLSPLNIYQLKELATTILLEASSCLTLNRPGGGGIRPQAGSFLCCAETVSSRKLKLSDFYYILIGLNSEYKAVPWDIHCCHGNAIVEGCSVKFWLKSVENCIFQLKLFSNLSLGLLFVISILKLPPIPNFKQIRLKTKKLGFSAIF